MSAIPSSFESQSTGQQHKYEMRVSLSVLSHLGINLYSNVAAVLTEVVANAYDADALRVDISLSADQIVITDDGFGMTVSDMNERYLLVGYQKRDHAELRKTPRGRDPMGRKGIGKLSLFSIAGEVEIQSAKDGDLHGLTMTVQGIERAIGNGAGTYYPPELPTEEVTVEKGTRITLTDLRRGRIPATAAALRKKLARRFSVIGSDEFRVFVDDVEVTLKDRDDLKHVQFLWSIGESNEYGKYCDDLRKEDSLPDSVEWAGAPPPQGWIINGWIGSVKSPSQLKTPEGNLNSVVVHARGRLFQENILEVINDGGIYTKYLTGQLEADFLDNDDMDDIATSDRQRVVEDDDRYGYLISFLKQSLRKIAKQWDIWREEEGASDAAKENPAIEQWLETLSDGVRPHAIKLVARIKALPLEDKPEERKELYRHAIYAFERLRIKEMTGALAEAITYGAERLIPLLERHDDLESTLYYDIAKGRMDVISSFKGLVDADAKERVLQKYLFDHLWLLDPSWERADDTQIMESRVMQEWGDIDAKLTDEERKGRLDIKYRTTAGQHLVIELKRASVSCDVMKLVAQGRKYKAAIEKCAAVALPGKNARVEVIFVLGKPVEDAAEVTFVESQLESVNGRIVYYDSLIDSAQRAYMEYTKKQDKAATIAKLINQI
ncbi:BbrUII/HgiDII family restriction enzyme [Burkholderia gladioli]|uniref:BbrUII/HgiDII family restriction enzyme n=1 Tax=Burkholderia gladioli TaxID=28095 RepID=UPI0030CDA6FA